MNLLDLLAHYVSDTVNRRVLAFVLGFSLMWMVMTAQEILAERWTP